MDPYVRFWRDFRHPGEPSEPLNMVAEDGPKIMARKYVSGWREVLGKAASLAEVVPDQALQRVACSEVLAVDDALKGVVDVFKTRGTNPSDLTFWAHLLRWIGLSVGPRSALTQSALLNPFLETLPVYFPFSHVDLSDARHALNDLTDRLHGHALRSEKMGRHLRAPAERFYCHPVFRFVSFEHWQFVRGVTFFASIAAILGGSVWCVAQGIATMKRSDLDSEKKRQVGGFIAVAGATMMLASLGYGIFIIAGKRRSLSLPEITLVAAGWLGGFSLCGVGFALADRAERH